jgi:hypothetical protein
MLRTRSRFLPLGAVFIAAGLLLAASPGLASDPASQQITAPTTPGAKAKVAWTGTIPPGSNQGDHCADPADHHEIKLTVPAGTYNAVRVQATFSATYDGPTNDVKFTVVAPDGKQTSGDSGFVDSDESLGLSNLKAGTYDVVVCMFAGVAPQAYDGELVLEASKVEGPAGPTCNVRTETPKFTEDIIDEDRAGGEPIVTTLDNGRLLWGSHAGTTHFFGPAAPDPDTDAFVKNYQGQTYQYFSNDNGKTWEFVPRTPINNPGTLAGLPASGFSDPEFAIDAAGQIYISEINLANIAVSKSTDGGRSYELVNLAAFVGTDRQWMAADAKDVLYMTGNGTGSGGTFPSDPAGHSGHFMAKSTDGGFTWSKAITSNPNGVADIQIDPRDGTLYEISADSDGTLGMAAFRKIRGETDATGFTDPEISTIAKGVGYTPIQRLIDPTFDMDAKGNLYIVFSENGTGARTKGIYYSYSTDRAKSWAKPIRVDPGSDADIWPWIAVGEPGHVAIAYLAIDKPLENNNAETAADDDGWNVMVAQTANGLGCADADAPGFLTTKASAKPVHYGTICQGGTLCQTELVDRRLGDYFTNEIDGEGHTYIAVSNTADDAAGGSVSLPMVIRQVGGLRFGQDKPGDHTKNKPDDSDIGPDDGTPTGPDLPATGGGALVLVGLAMLIAGGALRRRRTA